MPVTQQQAIDNPAENLGRDVYLDQETNDIVISSSDDFTTVRYQNNLIQAIINRLKTQIGETELHPNYGSRLPELIGTNPTDLTLSIVRMHVREALLQEPRVAEIVHIKPSFRAGSNKQTIDVDLRLRPINNLATLNLVYSLFI